LIIIGDIAWREEGNEARKKYRKNNRKAGFLTIFIPDGNIALPLKIVKKNFRLKKAYKY